MITVKDYLNQTQKLIDSGRFTDGCTTPFKTFIHRWLKHSHLLCAAHDFGSLGLINGVKPGIRNNYITWLAHLSYGNPVYWLWGSIVSLATLPWVVWRRDLGIEFLPFTAFHAAIIMLSIVITLMVKFP